MKTQKEYYIGQRGLINDIIKLCFDINEKTKRSVFIYYSGHVGKIEFSINEGKRIGYSDTIIELDVSYKTKNKKQQLLEFKQQLIDILNDPNSYEY